MRMLLELHCAHDHRNFEDIAAHYRLSMPVPRPDCWACLMSKPFSMTHDKVAVQRASRAYEGFAADAKGPLSPPTAEGYRYFFLIMDLYSHYYWPVLAKSTAEWKNIWPEFVKRVEAKAASERVVSYIITDGHKVHVQGLMQKFNASRGIEGRSCAPYSQWQDPAERAI